MSAQDLRLMQLLGQQVPMPDEPQLDYGPVINTPYQGSSAPIQAGIQASQNPLGAESIQGIPERNPIIDAALALLGGFINRGSAGVLDNSKVAPGSGAAQIVQNPLLQKVQALGRPTTQAGRIAQGIGNFGGNVAGLLGFPMAHGLASAQTDMQGFRNEMSKNVLANQENIQRLNQNAVPTALTNAGLNKAMVGLPVAYGQGAMARGVTGAGIGAAGNVGMGFLQDQMSGTQPTAQGVLQDAGMGALMGGALGGILGKKGMPQAAQQAPQQVQQAAKQPIRGRVAYNEPVERSFNNNVYSSENTAPQLASKLEFADPYIPVSNEATLGMAREAIAANPVAAEQYILNKKLPDATDVALGQELMRRLQNEASQLEASGKSVEADALYGKAAAIAETLASKLTELGRAVQAASLWGRLTPEGALRKAASIAQESGQPLNVGLAKEISELAIKMKSLPEGNEKHDLALQLMARMMEAAPANSAQKVALAQTMAQLLNFKTFARNIIGNQLFAGAEFANRHLATLIDVMVSKFTGKRTTFLPDMDAALSGFKKGLRRGVKDVLTGTDSSGNPTKFDLPKARTFRGEVAGFDNNLSTADNLGSYLESLDERMLKAAREGNLGSQVGTELETLLGLSLRVADGAFYESAFGESLARQIKANKTNGLPEEVTENMALQAHLDGLYATFQDESVLAEMFSTLKRGFNKVGVGDDKYRFGLGDLVLKYPKTPANIMQRAIDYSPLGVVNTFKTVANAMAKGGQLDQRAFVDSLSRSLTGTGIATLGYTLGKLQLATGKRDSSEKRNEANKAYGRTDDSLNASGLLRFLFTLNPEQAKDEAGDVYYNYGFAQPLAAVLQSGISLANAEGTDEEENALDQMVAVVDQTLSGVDSIVDQPMMSGVRTLLGGYGGLSEGLVDTATNLPSSFTPSILAQAAQMIDPVSRETRDKNPLREAMNRVADRTPFASKMLPPKESLFGGHKERFPAGHNAFNVFMNPSNMAEVSDDEIVNEIMSVYDDTGSTDVLPTVVGRSVEYRTKKDPKSKAHKLSAGDISSYQGAVADKTRSVVKMVMAIPEYSELTSTQKAKIFNSINDASNEVVKMSKFGHLPVKENKLRSALVDNDLEKVKKLLESKVGKQLGVPLGEDLDKLKARQEKKAKREALKAQKAADREEKARVKAEERAKRKAEKEKLREQRKLEKERKKAERKQKVKSSENNNSQGTSGATGSSS